MFTSHSSKARRRRRRIVSLYTTCTTHDADANVCCTCIYIYIENRLQHTIPPKMRVAAAIYTNMYTLYQHILYYTCVRCANHTHTHIQVYTFALVTSFTFVRLCLCVYCCTIVLYTNATTTTAQTLCVLIKLSEPPIPNPTIQIYDVHTRKLCEQSILSVASCCRRLYSPI